MNNFDLESYLTDVYTNYPEANHQPIIGLTANYSNIDATLRSVYYQQIVKAGGTPVIIPPVADKDVIINTLSHLDGLILTGGADYNPLWAGEEPSPKLHHINRERDLAELMIDHPSCFQPSDSYAGNMPWHTDLGNGTGRQGHSGY